MNSELDLALERVIRAPRSAVWAAWIDPRQFEQWWIPAPMACRVDLWEPSMGGAFVTSVSEDGENFVPHMDACFLLVEHLERIVFTNALDSHWHPADPTPDRITAEITLVDHPEGTLYRAVVRHADPAARTHHEELGFFEGWGAATAQLAGKAEEAGAAHGAE